MVFQAETQAKIFSIELLPSALIPAFDPRPGRTNVPQTSDIEIAPPVVVAVADDDSSAAAAAAATVSASPPPEEGKVSPLLDPSQPKLQLCLRGPNLPGIVDVEIDLNEPEWTIFRSVQYVMQVRKGSVGLISVLEAQK